MIVVKNDKIEYLSNDTLVGEVLFQKETDYLVLTTARRQSGSQISRKNKTIFFRCKYNPR